ncbi:unnamed protein product [Alopecurus aequalis]
MASLGNSGLRTGTIISVTGFAAGSKSSRRRGTVVSETGLVARRENPTRRATTSSLAVRCVAGKIAGRSKQGRAAGGCQQMLPAKICFIKKLNDKEDGADDGYKSPPGTPPREPLTMKWQ